MAENYTKKYLESLTKKLGTGTATEHSYRGCIETLFNGISPGTGIINEPSNVTDCGCPDFVITGGGSPIGYIEAKDIGKDLDKNAYKEQFGRYKKALENLIITDYLLFRFYRNGELAHEVRIGESDGHAIAPIKTNFQRFAGLISEFCATGAAPIESPKKLASMMAGKARLLRDIIARAIAADEKEKKKTPLKDLYETFKKILIHDLDANAFADLYAQTLAYGMFAARLHCADPDNFTRESAIFLIPKTNPFLRRLFGQVAGPDIDARIEPIMDNLAGMFRASGGDGLLAAGPGGEGDPVIHFYETFLSEYDPALRKGRGVWYTPAPVVGFIVRSVDHVLKTKFGLAKGLADTSMATGKGGEAHKVQILDPATGTGTFLAETVKFIHGEYYGETPGAWPDYVDTHLIPRLHGFELLMASYAIAHLKMALLLKGAGDGTKRANIFLTNSLEKTKNYNEDIFSVILNEEAEKADRVKEDTPVMCIMGNPPYNCRSTNKSDWVLGLVKDYRYEPGTKDRLQEKSSPALSDDYVKFIRFGQYFIEKNKNGVLAFINPHGFLDAPTFRGMRYNLLKTYDEIYVLDLHGNARKKETLADGTADENVFDIMQGVCINIFVKTGNKKDGELGKVFHHGLFGKREGKYKFLENNTLGAVKYKELSNVAPMYYFVPKDHGLKKEYDKGFSVKEMFGVNNSGMGTSRDKFTIHTTEQNVKNTIETFLGMDDEAARARFKLGKDAGDWKVGFARKDLQNNYPKKGLFAKVSYRPFDDKWTYYTGNNKGFISRPTKKITQHFLKGDNVGLVMSRQSTFNGVLEFFITKHIADKHLVGCSSTIFPLYLYPETYQQATIGEEPPGTIKRRPNMDRAIVDRIAGLLGLRFTDEKEGTPGTFAPLDIMDYIYACMHSPAYRKKYNELLRTDYPRVPYPEDTKEFWRLAGLGGRLRETHLLERTARACAVTYPMPGDNIITRAIGKNDWELTDARKGIGRIWINKGQYFDGIPSIAWGFYIGGYKPAQKWLKDRKKTTLACDDIEHYQKIINALAETASLMGAIDGRATKGAEGR